MSLHVDREKVSAVLLPDGWHTVLDHSFDLDAYEYHDEDRPIFEGDQVTGIPSTGASWLDKQSGAYIVCPLAAVLAVRLVREKTERKLKSKKKPGRRPTPSKSRLRDRLSR